MTADGGELLRRELEALKARLERVAREHVASLEGLRLRISELEQRIGKEQKVVRLPVEEVVEDFEENEEEVILPPPLPEMEPVPRVAATVPEEMKVKVEEKDGGFEMQLGRVWLVRLGIVLLLTGLVLLGNFAYKNWIRELPNGVRLLGLFACAGVLIELGRRLSARPALQRFGEVLFGGGLAFFYYCTFASHHVGRLRVIDSPVVAAVLLLLSAGLIGWVSWVRNSRTIAVMGIVLASYSTMLQPIGWLSCVSSMVLAAAGLFLMRRPGWAGPGVAAMIGTYGAFLGWQMLGAAGAGSRNPEVMWFLQPVWVMFALPGIFDRFGEAMTERARARFTGANNALFFVLFSWLWVDRSGTEDYWIVCGVFGGLLAGLGIFGRRMGRTAGGVNLFQGLALLSLAMVIKLDGYHLALGLAGESLALALAFATFRGRTELLFSWLGAFGAAMMMVVFRNPNLVPWDGGEAPLWSAGMAALVIAAASVMLRVGVERCGEDLKGAARVVGVMVFFFSVLAAIAGWAVWLAKPWPLPVMAGISAALSAVSLVLDRKRWMPEVCVAALVFLAVAAVFVLTPVATWASAVAGIFALAAAWIWHRSERGGEVEDELDLQSNPSLSAWAYSMAAAGAAYLTISSVWSETAASSVALGAGGLGLVAIARVAWIHRLAPCASLLVAAGLVRIFLMAGDKMWPSLWIAAFAISGLVLAFVPKIGGVLPEWHRQLTGAVLRVTAFVAACVFWWEYSPLHFGDGLALMAILLTGMAFVRKVPATVEVWGFLVLAVLWLLKEFLMAWTRSQGEPTWRGWLVVLALFALVVWTRFAQRTENRASFTWAGWVAMAMGSIWATQMLVWRHDWQAVSVLWTVLGFAAVSAGLGLRLVVFRQAGLVLLGMAVIKVFAKDVWDFNAFMRVVAFIVLGAALILLGLFYNRFAPVLKRLMEEERRDG